MSALQNYKWGSFSFQEVGPGFTAFRIDTADFAVHEFLLELKLIVKKQGSPNYRHVYEFEPSFKEFLAEHGYHNTVDVIRAIRNEGLIMKAERAITFRLCFL